MVKPSNFMSYILISMIWLVLELDLTRCSQCSSMALLAIIINVASMMISSYKSAYSKYLIMLNMALLTIVGFLVPQSLVIPYTVVLTASVILYLILIRALELGSFTLSLLVIYVSYVLERVLMRLPILDVFKPLIEEVGINAGLFTVVLAWYLSLFIVSVIIILLIMLLSKKY